uniref:Flavonoid 3'-monooxygenase n=1 Tax=Euphorbia pulcherrima TaxID=37495 RepID=A0A455JC55_EUPPU|nr:flavonoid 3'hydroxylase [Euphorbia pulcherrima]
MLPLFAFTIFSAIFISFFFFFFRRTSRPPLPPGPRPLPVIGNLPHLGPKPHQSIASLARVYGPLMHLRMGFVDVVVAASASVAAQFLKAHDANFSSRPPNSGAKYVAYNYQDLVFAPYGPRWRMLRKISAVHLFSAKALDDFRHVRQEEVAILVRSLVSSGHERAVNLGHLVNLCATNALARVMIGRRVFSDSGDPKADEFKSMVVELMRLAGVFNIGDFIPALEWLDLQRVAAKMKKLHKRFDAFLTEIVEEHKSNKGESTHRDMLTTLISLKEEEADDGEGGKITDTEIKALLLNMFAAGTDTTSSTVEWAIAELIRHPKILTKLRRELDSVVGADCLVTELDITQLPYLQAVVKETFRLHPSTPLSLPRMAAESCEINGYHIPKGATLLVNVWAIARDPEVWKEPLEFRPERFLAGGERPNADVKGTDFEVIPFGAGRRICAGMNLGLVMVQLLIASLVQGFEWELEREKPEKLNMEEAYGLTLQRLEPLMVHPNPRLSSLVYAAPV